MAQQKHVYNVTFKTAAGIQTRMVDADNQFQAKEKIKIKASSPHMVANGQLKIISAVKIR